MKKLYTFLTALLLMVITGCSGGGGDSAPATLSSAKAITAFSLGGVGGTINETGKTITVSMYFGTKVTALVATFTTTGSSVKVGSTVQISGTTGNNFTAPVAYTVTAADSSSAIYTVTVTVAAAPLIRLPKTGQTVCYNALGGVISCANTGQDGELQKGITWPNPRFTDNSDQTITDNLTGLMWTKDSNAPGPTACTPGVTKTFKDALTYTSCLNTNNYLGHDDWRVPNINELRSLINYDQSDLGTWLNTQGFSNVQNSSSAWYWSSTTDAVDGRLIFMNSEVWGGSRDDSCYVWPVRTGPSGTINLPKTGQTVCYDYDAHGVGISISCANTGQDGELQKGFTWPTPRFTNNGDQTITDNLTGLMWTQNANAPGPVGCNTGVTMVWQDALTYAACLNTNNYLGHNDWRLPNVDELTSLINFGQSSSSTWLNTQGFSNVPVGGDVMNYYYWSSTTKAPITGPATFAWAVTLDFGGGYEFGKTDSYYVWPVRAGQ